MTIRKVLIVDDMPMIVDRIKRIITEAGLNAVTADTGQQALEYAKAESPDLIFMDIMMPGLDGYAACRQLRMDKETKHIPVVFVSSRNQKSDRLWAEMQGGKAYIVKPFSKQDILTQIDTFQNEPVRVR